MTPHPTLLSHPCSLLASLTLFPARLMRTNPWLSNGLPEQVLCISCVVQYFIYFVSLFLYIIFLQIVDVHGWAWESLSLVSSCDMILFNMPFIILSILLFLKRYHLSYLSWKYLGVFSWELTYNFNKGTNSCLINTCVTPDDLMYNFS